MYKRKKYKNCLNIYGFISKKVIFFMLVLNFQMILLPNCYAETLMPADKIEYLVDNLFYFNNNNGINYANCCWADATNKDFILAENDRQNAISFWTQAFNNNNNIDFMYNFFDFIGYNIWYFNGSNYQGSFFYTSANMGTGTSNFPYIYFEQSRTDTSTGNYNFYPFFINDNKEIVNQSMRRIDYVFNLTSRTFTLINYGNANSITSILSNHILCRMEPHWNTTNTNISSINTIGGIVTFYNTNAIYTNFDGTNFFNEPTVKLLKTGYSGGGSLPDDPTPPADTGETGTITNNSGETTGSIDLSGIQNQLGTINNNINDGVDNIIESQNDNTQAIIDNQNTNAQNTINAINNANENYWGGEEDLTGEEQENYIENNVNNIMDSLSGDLAEIEVMGILEEAEKGFTDKFIDVKNAPVNAFDLKFEWDDIKYNGETIIEAGVLNISEMVRNNETLEVVHGYIRVIAIFVVVMNILKTIYNMIMQALGIIQPEIRMEYETPIADKEIDQAQGGYMLNDTIHL